ncbi:MAG TPA: hypothetical protein PKE04_04925, partial [Clostridia bacterium]|nr:hypothetical protein [Clostridia bacterium]
QEGAALTLKYNLRLPKIRDDRAAQINAEYEDLLNYYKDSYVTMLYNEQKEAWTESDVPLEVSLDFQIHFNDGEILSIVLCDGANIQERLTETYTAETYSLVDGRQLTLSDIIQTSEPALSVAAREVARQIEEARKSDNVWGFYDDVDENIVSMYLSETSFYLREDGAIVLILNPIGISESESGLCEFVLDASLLSD